MSDTVKIELSIVRDINGRVACEKTNPYETCPLFDFGSDSCTLGGGYDTYSVHNPFDTKIGFFDCPIILALEQEGRT